MTAQQNFALQYITVMIIILAFLVGTFSGRKFDKKTASVAQVIEVPTEQAAPAAQGETLLKSELAYKDLFDKASSKVVAEKAFPIATLLSNHDLIASIQVNLGFCVEGQTEECFQKEMNAAENLANYLSGMDLPADSYRVYYSPELAGAQTIISFSMDQHGT